MMPEHSENPGIETLIGYCNHFLSLRNFSGSRDFALAALESDPSSPEAAQVLAISDVLLAAERRLRNNCLDYYSILQVTRPESESRQVVLSQFKKLLALLNPSKNKFSFCEDAFDLVCDAWAVLSKPEKKRKYDFEIGNDGANKNLPVNLTKIETYVGMNSNRGEKDEEKPKEGTLNRGKPNLSEGKQTIETLIELKRKEGTFWTVCAYCYFLYEYETEYRECCLRCQNCGRGFHAVEVGPLPPGLVVNGRDEYYCAIGFFKFGYPWDDFFDVKKDNCDQMENVVEISDDSNDDHIGNMNPNVKNGEMGADTCKAKQENSKREGERIAKNITPGLVQRRLNGKRVKTVAMNTKKGMKKIRTTKSMSPGLEDDEDDLGFFEGHDDIYVSVKDCL